MRRTWIRWALAFALLFAAPAALAQTPEADALATHIAHEMIDAIDFEAVVLKGAQSSAASLRSLDEFRPTWSKLMLEAMAEEVGVSGPVIERIIGRRMAKLFTLDELKAGDIIISDRVVKAVISAGARGEKHDAGDCSRDCMRALKQPAGQSFMRKLQDSDKIFGADAVADLVAAITPGFLRRLADKIEASER